MSRPHSAKQGPKKIYLGNRPKDQYKNQQEYLPNIQYKQPNYYDMKEDTFNEEISILQNAWNELGITPEYRAAFINLAKNVTESERKDIFMQEKINLKKFRDALINLKKEITNRENNLALLKKLDKTLQTCINNENNANSIDNILHDVINIIKNLRLNAVNIVSKIIKVNQMSAYYSNSGKFDTRRINPEYSYDPQYLFKMKEDLLFLKNSTLSTFIEMNNTEIDAFLTNCAPIPNKVSSSQKIKIPISDDIMKSITESRYTLLQETVLANVDKDDISNLRSYDFYEGTIRRGSSGKKFRNLEEEKFRLNKNRPYLMNITNNSAKKKHNNFFKNPNTNMSKYIYDLKNVNGANRYNYLFYKNPQPIGNRLRSGKKRLFNNNNNSIPNYSNNNTYGKRIPIEHDVIQSLTNEQYLKKLNGYKSPDDNNKNKNNNEDILYDEMGDLKKENKKYETEINELKRKIEFLEKKAKDEETKRENLQNKYKELSQRTKDYQAELEKISKNKKKAEYELNNKIEKLEKEKQDNLKLNNEEKDKLENQKKETKKKEDELIEKIKNLENQLKTEENERIEKEKELEDIKNKLKEEKEEREKEKLQREEEDKRREE